MDFKKLFENFSCNKNEKYHQIFQIIKPYIINKIMEFLNNRPIKKTGRPITIDFNKFMDGLFFLIESGSQLRYVTNITDIPKSTFHRYLKIITDNHIIENVYKEIILPPSELLITDTFSVKSMRGSFGLGRNPTDRGRKGLKVSLICDTNRVTHAVHVDACNIHDTKMLIKTLNHIKQPIQPVKCLCDAGYVGKQLSQTCHSKNFDLIVKPRNTTKRGHKTHVLSDIENNLLIRYRNRIELLNGHIRRFRGLMIKWVRDITIYQTFLYIVLLCITCYQLYI